MFAPPFLFFASVSALSGFLRERDHHKSGHVGAADEGLITNAMHLAKSGGLFLAIGTRPWLAGQANCPWQNQPEDISPPCA